MLSTTNVKYLLLLGRDCSFLRYIVSSLGSADWIYALSNAGELLEDSKVLALKNAETSEIIYSRFSDGLPLSPWNCSSESEQPSAVSCYDPFIDSVHTFSDGLFDYLLPLVLLFVLLRLVMLPELLLPRLSSFLQLVTAYVEGIELGSAIATSLLPPREVDTLRDYADFMQHIPRLSYPPIFFRNCQQGGGVTH